MDGVTLSSTDDFILDVTSQGRERSLISFMCLTRMLILFMRTHPSTPKTSLQNTIALGIETYRRKSGEGFHAHRL